MISWIQRSFQHHFRMVFGVLLAVTIISFIFTIGGALAAPFAGIFRTTYATPGTLIIWADVLAVVVYAIAAVIVVKLVSMGTDQHARRST